MFFTPGTHKDHGLSHSPYKAIVAPRPIGWISTISTDGSTNLAPYSFFNAISEIPPMVGFSAAAHAKGAKDSLVNIRDTGEFVVNIVAQAQINAMSQTSADLPHNVSEFEYAGLTPIPSKIVKPPMVKESPCQLECRLWDMIALPAPEPKAFPDIPAHAHSTWVMGQVVGIHISDNIITNGKIDVLKYKPVARLGYMDYAVVDNLISIKRPS